MKPKNPQTNSTRISFEGRKYCGIIELGFSTLEGRTDEHFVVNLYNSPVSLKDNRRGRFFTCIPISPWEYRKDHPTSASYFRSGPNRIMISSDYGQPSTIVSTKAVVDELVAECKKYNLPEVKRK